MDDETKAALDTMMARINDNHEQVLRRFNSVELGLNAVLNTLNTVATTMGLVAHGFADHARRITDLEKK